MNLKQYIFFMIIGTFIAFFSFGTVVVSVDPARAGFTGLALFYASLFAGVVGITSILSFLARFVFARGEGVPLYRLVERSFRTGMYTGSLAVILLILQSERLLTPMTGGLFLLSALVLAIFLNSLRSRRAIG